MKFTTPDVEVMKFANTDVIATSPLTKKATGDGKTVNWNDLVG